MGIGLADVLVKGKLPRGRAWFVGIVAREIACVPVLLIWAQSQSNQLPCGLPSKPCTI